MKESEQGDWTSRLKPRGTGRKRCPYRKLGQGQPSWFQSESCALCHSRRVFFTWRPSFPPSLAPLDCLPGNFLVFWNCFCKTGLSASVGLVATKLLLKVIKAIIIIIWRNDSACWLCSLYPPLSWARSLVVIVHDIVAVVPRARRFPVL